MKPCPFCGFTEIKVLDSNEIEELDPEYDDHFDPAPSLAAICDINAGGCGATGGYRNTREEAAAAWEMRK